MAFIYSGGAAPENHLKAPIEVNFQIDYTTPSGSYDIPVPGGYRIDTVATVVTQVCDGTPTLEIGDADDDDGYLTSVNIEPGTAATGEVPAVKRSSGIANPYQFGKYLAADGVVRLIWVKGTTPTTGVIKGSVTMTNVTKGGVPAGLTTLTPV